MQPVNGLIPLKLNRDANNDIGGYYKALLSAASSCYSGVQNTVTAAIDNLGILCSVAVPATVLFCVFAYRSTNNFTRYNIYNTTYTVKFKDLKDHIESNSELEFFGLELNEANHAPFKDEDHVSIILASKSPNGRQQFTIKTLTTTEEYLRRGLLNHFTSRELEFVSVDDERFRGLTFTQNQTLIAIMEKEVMGMKFYIGSAFFVCVVMHLIYSIFTAPLQFLNGGDKLPNSITPEQLLPVSDDMHNQVLSSILSEVLTRLRGLISREEAFDTEQLITTLISSVIIPVAKNEGLKLVADSVQNFCATIYGTTPGTELFTYLQKNPTKNHNKRLLAQMVNSIKTSTDTVAKSDRSHEVPIKRLREILTQIFNKHHIAVSYFHCNGVELDDSFYNKLATYLQMPLDKFSRKLRGEFYTRTRIALSNQPEKVFGLNIGKWLPKGLDLLQREFDYEAAFFTEEDNQ